LDFEDIENENGEIKLVSTFQQSIHFKATTYEITESYYSWACEMLYTGSFLCERHKIIWEYHSQGKTGSEIAKRLGYQSRAWVNRLIKKIKRYLKQAPV
jgi:hypothetical protein